LIAVQGPPIAVLMTVGGVAVFTAWRMVVGRRATVWNLIAPLTGLLGAAAVLTGRVGLSPGVHPVAAAVAGVGAGILLYGATAAFVLIVRRWPVFDRHVAEIYGQRRGFPLAGAVILAAGVTASGEELFWRGLFQEVLAVHLGSWGAAGAAWAAYIAAASGSGSLPIVAAAVVGGAVWGGLAVWTQGVLAGLACHAVWTTLMLVAPPGGTSPGPAGFRRADASRPAT
jgi:membrane protease YdiL (CAAX protease family)